jgi:hypothetical protein
MTMKAVACFLLPALLPGLAHGQDSTSKAPGPAGTGLTIAVGLGYGVGFGTFYTAAPGDASGLPTNPSPSPSVGDEVSGLLPFGLSLGYRPIPLLSFGVVLSHAPIFLKDCGQQNTCPGSDSRVGAELRWHIVPGRRPSPWASAGFGYEWFRYSRDPAYDSSRKVGASGFDFDFQVGGDFPLSDLLTIGPYVGLRVGTFGHYSMKCGWRSCVGARTEYDIPDESSTTHGWLTIGLRGAVTVPGR